MNKDFKFIIHDIEVLPNLFIAGFKIINGKTYIFEISARRNDLEEMIDFITRHHNKFFVGYNCNGYDEPVLRALFKKWNESTVDLGCTTKWLELTDFIKRESDTIINKEGPSYHHKKDRLFPTIDLMTMLFSQNLRVGLKPLQVTMCFPNVEEMDVNWNEWLSEDKFDALIGYNRNDLDSTEYLLKMLKSDISLRLSIKKNYGIDCLSKDGVGVGVDIFTKYICAELGLEKPSHLKHYRENLDIIFVKDFILPEISFTTPSFQKVLADFQTMVLDASGSIVALRGKKVIKKKSKSKKESKETQIVGLMGNYRHTFGLGGLHCANDPLMMIADNGYHIIDCDVKSGVVTL